MISLRWIPIILLALAAGGVPTSSLAQGAIQSENVRDESFFVGLVTSIDRDGHRVTVKEAGSDRRMAFTIPAEVRVLRGESPFRLDAIQVGDPVSIEFHGSARGPMVSAVKVIAPPHPE
jgi:hypothetical protein